ncbi:MAG: hypothetical protein AB9835_08875 [Eubacteriales bacterium]
MTTIIHYVMSRDPAPNPHPSRRGGGFRFAALRAAPLCLQNAEGFTVSGGCDMYATHHGYFRLFEKCGFSVH